ncbi:uncharacterized protein MEPE_01209 [Melanopsichium pennsylvanicum]|uniref:Uncharacterized protein n=1 Tax=Melanopsichium pennsylvanicum TaxID=63383 RepID=A0AAJ4XI16_9BASI|nr:uncharacterized protein MEPE_01209 [Melanopsichium pennsylvanicum]
MTDLLGSWISWLRVSANESWRIRNIHHEPRQSEERKGESDSGGTVTSLARSEAVVSPGRERASKCSKKLASISIRNETETDTGTDTDTNHTYCHGDDDAERQQFEPQSHLRDPEIYQGKIARVNSW